VTEKYIKGFAALIVSILILLCLVCFGAAGWVYILAEQTPPVFDRLICAGSWFGITGFGVSVIAYSTWEL
jgi:hypothetical protein